MPVLVAGNLLENCTKDFYSLIIIFDRPAQSGRREN